MAVNSGKASAWEDQEEVTGWDYNSFHIKTTNDHDHSDVLNIARTMKLPQSVLAQVHSRVDDPRNPYRTPSDVLRDAVVHRLAYLAEQDGHSEWVHANNLEAFRQSIKVEEALEAEMFSTIQLMRERGNKLAMAGHVTELWDLFRRAESAQVEGLYRPQWLQMVTDLKTQYDRLVPDDHQGDLEA